MKYNKIISALLLCSALTLSYPQIALSQEIDKKTEKEKSAPESPKQEEIKVDFNKLESFGLLDTVESGSLGKGLYKGSDRSILIGLMKKLSTNNGLIGLQRLNNNMLLTAANAGDINNDIKISAGEDLGTLRLESLLKRGMNIQAFEFVSKLEEDALYDTRIAKTAVLSMLFSGEKGSACLENNAMKDSFAQDGFWNILSAYCSIKLSDTPPESAKIAITQSNYQIIKNVLSSDTYTFDYTPDTFNALPLEERAILVAEKKISIKQIDHKNFAKIPATHIQSIMNGADITSQQKLILTALGIERGVLPPYALAEEFMLITQKLAETKKAPEAIEELAPIIKKVKGAWHIDDPIAGLEKSMNYAQQYGAPFLIPFLQAYEEKNNLDEYSLNQVELIVRAFIYSNQTVPKTWFENILQRNTTNDDEEFLKSKLIMAVAVLSPDKVLTQFKTAQYRTNFTEERSFPLFSYKNIIENIDNSTTEYARVRYIYENDETPAWNKDYKMPPHAAVNELEEAAKKGNVAEVIGLSDLLVAKANTKVIYPGLITKVYESLTAVGLSKQAREIVAQAVLDIE